MKQMLRKLIQRKTLAWVTLALLVVIFSIKLGARVERRHNKHLDLNFIERAVLAIDEDLILNPFHIFKNVKDIKDIGAPPQKPIPDGVTHCTGKDSIPIDKKYLYTYFDFENNTYTAELLDLSTNRTLHTWKLKYDFIEDIYLEWCKNNHHDDLPKKTFRIPTLYRDTSIVVQCHYMLICLDKNSNIKWHSKKRYHHSLELDADSNLWACSYLSTASTYRGSQIVKLNTENGEVLFKKTIEDIFKSNPLHDRSHLNKDDDDPYHLNDVQPVIKDGKYWKQGDVFISLKNISTVFLYRPSTNKILWSNSIRWANQHDVEILNDSVISVYNNNFIEALPQSYIKGGVNQLMTYNFATDSSKVLYQKIFQQENIATPTQGKGSFYPDDSLLYAEATDLSFFVISDLKKGKSYKCYIPGRSKGKAGNLGWFRLID